VAAGSSQRQYSCGFEGKTNSWPLRPSGCDTESPVLLSFNLSLRVDFQGSHVTSDGGRVLARELVERLGLNELIEEHLTDDRRGKKGHLTWRRFGATPGRIALLPVLAGQRARVVESAWKIGPTKDGGGVVLQKQGAKGERFWPCRCGSPDRQERRDEKTLPNPTNRRGRRRIAPFSSSQSKSHSQS
jgi:hypothetical protein